MLRDARVDHRLIHFDAEFSERRLVEHGVRLIHAALRRAVAGKMLRTRDHRFGPAQRIALQTLEHCHAHFSSQRRHFGVALEGAPPAFVLGR